MEMMKKIYLDIWNNTSILMFYGNYLIFNITFFDDKVKQIIVNIDNHKKFQKIMKNIEKFHEKCKNYIKNDDLTVAQLYLASCLAYNDYLENNNYSDLDMEHDLIDLIDFKQKGTIYNAGYENNIELIKNLNKNSFIYPILLQFNSGFKIILSLHV